MKFQKIINNATRNVAAIVAMYAIMRINSERDNPSYANQVTAQAAIYANSLMDNLKEVRNEN
jgi:hypothetical protein